MTIRPDHSVFAEAGGLRAGARPLVPALALLGALAAGATEPAPDFHARFSRKRPATIGARMRPGKTGSGKAWGTKITALFACLLLVTMFYASRSYGSPIAALIAYGGGEATTDDDDTIRPMPFERPGDSFPGSAYYYLTFDNDPALGAAASDGIAALATGPAARAISVGSALDRTRAVTCLTTAIYYEAATEPDAGQKAVAQVILNRVAHPSFPKTVCDVVYQGSERVTGCQFTFTCDGSLMRHRPDTFFWNRAEAVARAALAGFVYAPVGLSTHYHTFAVHPLWDSQMNFVGQIGAHRFYRMMGPAGAEGAFRFAYAGREPMPGPHPRSLAPLANAPADDPLAIERAYAAGLAQAHAGSAGASPVASAVYTAPTYAAPAYTRDVLRSGGDSVYRAQNLPTSQPAKPEYEASGHWISEPQ